jgi:hypothetical protein
MVKQYSRQSVCYNELSGKATTSLLRFISFRGVATCKRVLFTSRNRLSHCKVFINASNISWSFLGLISTSMQRNCVNNADNFCYVYASEEVIFVRPSVHMEQLASHWTDFHNMWHLSISRKSVAKIQVPLKSDKNNGQYTFLSYLAQFSSEWETFHTRVVQKIKTHILCSITSF